MISPDIYGEISDSIQEANDNMIQINKRVKQKMIACKVTNPNLSTNNISKNFPQVPMTTLRDPKLTNSMNESSSITSTNATPAILTSMSCFMDPHSNQLLSSEKNIFVAKKFLSVNNLLVQESEIARNQFANMPMSSCTTVTQNSLVSSVDPLSKTHAIISNLNINNCPTDQGFNLNQIIRPTTSSSKSTAEKQQGAILDKKSNLNFDTASVSSQATIDSSSSPSPKRTISCRNIPLMTRSQINHCNKKSNTCSPTQIANKPVDLGKKLLDASRDGKVESVCQLMSSGAPFTADWLGTTSLHLASQNGHYQTVEVLLKAGGNLDARTKVDRTALHIAAQVGCVRTSKLLLSYGADVNVQDMLKMTPLHWSVERRHPEVVKLLLQYGADTEAKNKFMLTPVELAWERQYLDIVNIFVKCSQDVNDSNSNQKADLDIKPASTFQINPTLNNTMTTKTPSAKIDHELSHNVDNNFSSSHNTDILDLNDQSIDRIDLEWIKLEPDLFLQPRLEDERNVEYLMKIVDDLQKENSQLRQKVEQLTGT